jgi:hypothetical protein
LPPAASTRGRRRQELSRRPALQPPPPLVLHRPRPTSNPSALSNSGEVVGPPPKTLTGDRCRRASPQP